MCVRSHNFFVLFLRPFLSLSYINKTDLKYKTIILFLLAFGVLKGNDLNEIHKEVTEIVKHLHTTNGNFLRGGPPRVIISEEKNVGAAYNPIHHTLTIDLAVYNICQSFGKQATDALAVVLGHEMAHCYMEHYFFSDYNNYYKSEGSEISSEKGADIYGLFNAYLAGYNSFTMVPKVIAEIYKKYNLKDDLSGYPTKQERMESAKQVQSQIQELISIYESANYLSAIGKYDLAAASYEHILDFYQGREIYNNLGVNYALEAMYFTDKDYDLYLYPLEIDWNTRIKKPKLDKGDGDLSEAELEHRTAYLNLAKENFTKAGRMDQGYLTADINIICVMTLLNEYQKAVDYYEYLQKSKKLVIYGIDDHQKESARLAMANAKAHIPEMNDEADRILDELSKSDNPNIVYMATYNNRILEEGECGAPKEISCYEPIAIPQYVDDIRLHRFESVNQNRALSKDIEIAIDYFENSTVFQYLKEGNAIFSFQQIKSKNEKSTVQLDADEKFKIINSTNGYFIVCDDNRTVFQMTTDNKIKNWGKYY